MRRNTYDAATGVITLSADRAEAVQQVARHYIGLFGDEASLATHCASSTPCCRQY
jgi:nitric oxide reductase subunit B